MTAGNNPTLVPPARIAHASAGLGLRIFPWRVDRRGAKRPCVKGWPDFATTDPWLLDAWFHHEFDDAYAGVATGQGSNVWVLDVDRHGDVDGLATLARLEAEHGPLPETFAVTTPSGGRHLYFAWPADGSVVKTAKSVFPGIDTRGHRGFVAAPGTTTSAGSYEVDVDAPFASAPAWLVEGNRKVERERAEVSARAQGDPTCRGLAADRLRHHGADLADMSPGSGRNDALNRAAFMLGRYGAHGLLDEAAAWAALHDACRANGLVYEDGLAACEATFASGWTAGLAEPAALPGFTADDEDDGWGEVDLTDAAAGEKARARPTLLARADGACLLYPGQINELHGADGVGKSFVALFAAQQELDAGHHVVWLDWEDPDEVTVVGRLLDLGVAADVVLARFHYWHPEVEATPARVARLCARVRELGAALVVLDSVGEAFGLDGVNEDRDNEVTPWLRKLPRPLMATGAAVVLVDHGVKSAENELFPSGSKRKRAAITGAAYLVKAPRPVSREAGGGRLELTTAKDRHGHYTRGKVAATIDVTVDGAGMSFVVRPPRTEEVESPDGSRLVLAASLVRLVRDLAEETGALPSQRAVLAHARVKGGNEIKRAALEWAASPNVRALEEVDGPRRAILYRWLRDLVLDDRATAPDGATTAPGALAEPRNDRATAPPPYRGGRGAVVDGPIGGGPIDF
jgi:Bifunctional DNA primase/polymerase, N-terminal/AAA domain